MSKIEDDDDDPTSVYVIEIPTKHPGRDDVEEAKEKEIKIFKIIMFLIK